MKYVYTNHRYVGYHILSHLKIELIQVSFVLHGANTGVPKDRKTTIAPAAEILILLSKPWICLQIAMELNQVTSPIKNSWHCSHKNQKKIECHQILTYRDAGKSSVPRLVSTELFPPPPSQFPLVNVTRKSAVCIRTAKKMGSLFLLLCLLQ